MSTKLTLRLEDDVIENARRYGEAQGKSVSRMVSDYLRLLEAERTEAPDLSDAPLTASLLGALKDSGVDEQDYQAHLRDKYGKR